MSADFKAVASPSSCGGGGGGGGGKPMSLMAPQGEWHFFCLPKAEAMETETIRKFFLNHVVHSAPDTKETSGYQTICASVAHKPPRDAEIVHRTTSKTVLDTFLDFRFKDGDET